MCRKVLFSKYDRIYWESISHLPGWLGLHVPIPLLTDPDVEYRGDAIVHPELLDLLEAAQNQGSAGVNIAVGPAAEALALLRVLIGELSGNDAGAEMGDSIPVSHIDSAVRLLARQMGRLYRYYESRIDKETTSISWDSQGPEFSVLRDPVRARWCEWQLQELVYMERNRA